MPDQHFIKTQRQARYCTRGETGKHIKRLWLVCHGYGQLAPDFIENFRVLGEDQLVVAPEGLSRFYLKGARGSVGASWMTREAREQEIEDYLQFINQVMELYEPWFRKQQPELYVLGFSQGTATATRWALQTHWPVHHLILWGGFPPENFDDRDMSRFALPDCPVTFVYGNEDPYMSQEATDKLETLQEQRRDISVVKFEGKHEMDRGIIRQL